MLKVKPFGTIAYNCQGALWNRMFGTRSFTDHRIQTTDLRYLSIQEEVHSLDAYFQNAAYMFLDQASLTCRRCIPTSILPLQPSFDPRDCSRLAFFSFAAFSAAFCCD